MSKHEISKIDAARRQLDTAIRLYMSGRDDVSIHTLAHAAHRVLMDVAAKKGIDGYLFGHLMGVIKPEMKDEFLTKMNAAANFFKHADRDSGEVLEFNPEQTVFWLWDACILYQSLTGEYTDLMQCYWTWFGIQYPDAIKDTEISAKFKEAKATFRTRQEFMSTFSEVMNVQS